MTLRQVIQNLSNHTSQGRENAQIAYKLLPQASFEEIATFEKRLPAPIPGEIRDVLSFVSGIEISPLGHLDFLGRNMFEFGEAFPYGLPILGDGNGNFWMIDVHPRTGEWGPVFFVCHDPPVIVAQSFSLTSFVEQIIDSYKLLTFVKRTAVHQINRTNQDWIDIETARQSTDKFISSCAEALEESFVLFDLRFAETGKGFSYWEPGYETTVKRCGTELIFAIEYREIESTKKPGIFRRLVKW